MIYVLYCCVLNEETIVINDFLNKMPLMKD